MAFLQRALLTSRPVPSACWAGNEELCALYLQHHFDAVKTEGDVDKQCTNLDQCGLLMSVRWTSQASIPQPDDEAPKQATMRWWNQLIDSGKVGNQEKQDDIYGSLTLINKFLGQDIGAMSYAPSGNAIGTEGYVVFMDPTLTANKASEHGFCVRRGVARDAMSNWRANMHGAFAWSIQKALDTNSSEIYPFVSYDDVTSDSAEVGPDNTKLVGEGTGLTYTQFMETREPSRIGGFADEDNKYDFRCNSILKNRTWDEVFGEDTDAQKKCIKADWLDANSTVNEKCGNSYCSWSSEDPKECLGGENLVNLVKLNRKLIQASGSTNGNADLDAAVSQHLYTELLAQYNSKTEMSWENAIVAIGIKKEDWDNAQTGDSDTIKKMCEISKHHDVIESTKKTASVPFVIYDYRQEAVEAGKVITADGFTNKIKQFIKDICHSENEAAHTVEQSQSPTQRTAAQRTAASRSRASRKRSTHKASKRHSKRSHSSKRNVRSRRNVQSKRVSHNKRNVRSRAHSSRQSRQTKH